MSVLRAACVAVLAAALGYGRGAYAQSEAEVAARRVLIDQAWQADLSGDHAHALDLATRAGRLTLTPSLRLFITEQQEALGQLVPAFGNAELCLRDAERDAALPNRDVILERCRDAVQRLHGRVGTLTVDVPSPAPPGLRVVVAGDVLREALYDVPYTVSPGRVVIEATLAGHTPFREVVEVAPGVPAELRVVMAPLPAPVRVATSERRVARSSSARVIPWVALGAGAASLIASGVFLALREHAAGDCERTERALVCNTDDAVQQARAASGYHTAATVTFWASVPLLATGILWLALGRSAPPPVALSVAPQSGGAVIGLGGAL